MTERGRMPPMVLAGPRVSIRRVAWDDVPTICAWLNDPTVMREVRAEKLKPTLEQLRSVSSPTWRDPGPGDYHEHVICLGDRVVGEIGHVQEDPSQGTVSVNI